VEHPTGVPHGHHSVTSGNFCHRMCLDPRRRLRFARSSLLARARTAYPLPALRSRGRCRLRCMPVPHRKVPRRFAMWAVMVANFRRIIALTLAYARARSSWRSRHSSSTCTKYVCVASWASRVHSYSVHRSCTRVVASFRQWGLGPGTGSRRPIPVVLSAFRHASSARRHCSLLHSLSLLLLTSRLSRWCCQFLSGTSAAEYCAR
jgi:hypothetical protein